MARGKIPGWGWALIAVGALGVLCCGGGIVAALFLAPATIERAMEEETRHRALAEMSELRAEVDAWAAEHDGRYPATLDELVEAGRVRAARARDPWGRPYRYEPPNVEHPGPRLWSLGKDDRPGGAGADADLEVGGDG